MGIRNLLTKPIDGSVIFPAIGIQNGHCIDTLFIKLFLSAPHPPRVL
jgi:hypothetical protein